MYNKLMLIFLLIMLCISVPLVDFCNIIGKRKIRNSIYVILQIVAIQCMSMLFIGFIEINFLTYQIISYTLIGLSVTLFAAFIVYYVIKNKNIYQWSNLQSDITVKLKENCVLYFCVMLFVLLSLFQTNKLDDTLYYFEVSAMFRYDVLPESYIYILPGSYFLYGALSNGFVAQWYYLFTPISFYIVMASIINQNLVTVFKGRFKYLQIFTFMFFILLFSVFSLSTFISGNMYVAGCLIGLFMICIKEKDLKTPALLFLVSQFYSSTGMLISLGLIISTFIYLFVYKNINQILRLTPLYSASLFGLPLLVLSYARSSFGTVDKTWNYLFIGLFTLIILVVTLIFFWYKKRNKQNAFFEFGFMQTKWFGSNFMKYLILLAASVSLVIIAIYFQSIYYQSFVYSMIPFYLLLVLMLPLIVTNYCKQYKSEQNLNFLIMTNICVVSFVIIFLWIFDTENGSIWRIMMLLPTAGIGESTISYTILFALNVQMFIPYLISFDWKTVNKLNVLKSSKQAIITLSSLGILSSFVPIAVVAINPALANFTYGTYDANVSKNVNLFQSKDIDKMLSLGKYTSSSSWNFVFDNFASAYIAINPSNNNTFHFYVDIFENHGMTDVSTDARTNPIGSLGFYKSRLISSEWKNPVIVNQTLGEFSNYLNSYLLSLNWYVNTDVIFLDKHSEYFKYIEFNDSLNYDLNIFNEIAVVAKSNDVLETIKANI